MGVPGFWTQPLLKSWIEKGVITTESYNEKTIQLARAHYYFTSVDGQLLQYALQKHNLRVTPEVHALLKTLEGPHTTEDIAIGVVAKCIKDVWFTPALPEQRVFILIECLNVLTTKRNTWIVLQKLVRLLTGDLGLQLVPTALPEILKNIEAWWREYAARSRSSLLS